MPRLLKAAMILGAVPLLAGTAISATWRFTHWSWLETAGVVTIFIGVIAFILGLSALLAHLRREAALEWSRPRLLKLQQIFAGALLFTNFPLAAAFTLSAIDVSTRYTVRVDNDSDRPIESLVVTGPGVRVEWGPIAPGQHKRQRLHFRGDGALGFSARQQERSFQGSLEGYVTGGQSGGKILRIMGKGVYEIRPSR